MIKTLMKTYTTPTGQKISCPLVRQAEITTFKITVKPGAVMGGHKHDTPLFASILQGRLTTERENGDRKTFTSGSAVAEMIKEYHTGTNETAGPLVLTTFYPDGNQNPPALEKENP
jgi:quercetin dioxygenase-like cupin family protein